MEHEKIYAQVLLLDNKIEAYNIGINPKNSAYDFCTYWKTNKIKDYCMETICFDKKSVEVEDGWDFNFYVFNVLAPKWINQWEYSDEYRGNKAVVKTLEETKEEINSICRAIHSSYLHF